MDPVPLVEWEAEWPVPEVQKPALRRTATLTEAPLVSTLTDFLRVNEYSSRKLGRSLGSDG